MEASDIQNENSLFFTSQYEIHNLTMSPEFISLIRHMDHINYQQAKIFYRQILNRIYIITAIYALSFLSSFSSLYFILPTRWFLYILPVNIPILYFIYYMVFRQHIQQRSCIPCIPRHISLITYAVSCFLTNKRFTHIPYNIPHITYGYLITKYDTAEHPDYEYWLVRKKSVYYKLLIYNNGTIAHHLEPLAPPPVSPMMLPAAAHPPLFQA
jgi:hypothetical protein